MSVAAAPAASAPLSFPLALERASGICCEVAYRPAYPQSRGSAPLHACARSGREVIIRSILRSPWEDIDINIGDESGWTPLHWAAKTGQLPAARMLVQGGANLHARGVRRQPPQLAPCTLALVLRARAHPHPPSPPRRAAASRP